MYFYSIHSLAIKAPYVLYSVIVKYGLLSQKQILGKVHLSRTGAGALSFRGMSSHMRTVGKSRGAQRASRLSEAMFAWANFNFVGEFAYGFLIAARACRQV